MLSRAAPALVSGDITKHNGMQNDEGTQNVSEAEGTVTITRRLHVPKTVK